VLAGVGAAALAIVGTLATVLRPIPVEAARAHARIAAPRAYLYQTPAPGSRIATLGLGDPVNILEIPRARDQLWVHVQPVGPHKITRPGYARTSDLGQWDSADPDAKFRLIRLFPGSYSSLQEEIAAELDALSQFVKAFSGTHAAREAQVEMAQLHFSVARSLKEGGQTGSAVQNHLDSARSLLDANSGDPSIRTGVEDLQRQVIAFSNELSAAPAEVPVSGPPLTSPAKAAGKPPAKVAETPDEVVQQLLKPVDKLWHEHNYAEAEDRITKAMRVQRNHPLVLYWQEKLKSRREALN